MTINHWNEVTGALGELTRRKLEALAHIEKEFISSFTYVQEVHGQRGFTAFPVTNTARYLHALYICELKDHLLSVPQQLHRYDGERCLELLRGWQDGDTSSVVTFIMAKLDDQPFGELTRQIEDATRAHDAALVRRLVSGRVVLLNRMHTLAGALDAIFALEPKELRAEVRASCKRLGHTREQLDRQLEELRSDLYSCARSPALARRNMVLMNRIGAHIMDSAGDHPGERTDHVQAPVPPIAPYADALILEARTLVSMHWEARPKPARAPQMTGSAS